MRLLFMLNKAVAISTLAVLVAGDLTHQAIASPDPSTSTPNPPASNNYTVPVAASSKPQSTAAIAPPEVIANTEFASTQTPVSASASTSSTKLASTNNNVVVTATPQSPQLPKTPVSSTNQSAGTPTQSPTVNTLAQSTQTTTTTTNDFAVTEI